MGLYDSIMVLSLPGLWIGTIVLILKAWGIHDFRIELKKYTILILTGFAVCCIIV